MPMHNRRQRKNTGSDSCRDEAPERPPFRLLCRFLISLLVLTPGWSWAADIRLSGLSEKGELARITLNGEITAADVARFKDIVGLLKAANVRLTLVELNSRGGMVIPSMEIGTIIRENWLWTSVGIDDPGAVCYSSCVFIFVGGANRIPPDLTPIGIHRPFFEAELFAGLDKDDAKKKYNALLSNVRLYLDKMGIAPNLYQAMVQIPSNDLRILTFAEVQNWNISGDDPAYKEYQRAQNIAKYGEAKMREFDEYIKNTSAYLTECTDKGKPLELCAKETDAKYPNPIADWGK